MKNKCTKEAFELVKGYFKGDIRKTFLWFNTINPLLGGIKPIEMIMLGRCDKLLKFISSSIEDNFP